MDLLITPSGDLFFTEIDKESSRLLITFYKSINNALKVDFDVQGNSKNQSSEGSLMVSFDISHKLRNKRAAIVKDDAYKIQQIYIRLKTSLGELAYRTSIGSTLETVKHKNLNDSQIKSQVESIVAKAINDVLTNFTVEAAPEINKENGYKQIMNIKIYENNELLTTYQMEG